MSVEVIEVSPYPSPMSINEACKLVEVAKGGVYGVFRCPSLVTTVPEPVMVTEEASKAVFVVDTSLATEVV